MSVRPALPQVVLPGPKNPPVILSPTRYRDQGLTVLKRPGHQVRLHGADSGHLLRRPDQRRPSRRLVPHRRPRLDVHQHHRARATHLLVSPGTPGSNLTGPINPWTFELRPSRFVSNCTGRYATDAAQSGLSAPLGNTECSVTAYLESALRTKTAMAIPGAGSTSGSTRLTRAAVFQSYMAAGAL